MTKRRIHLDEALKNPDLGLITDYLADELDQDKVAEVRRRLEEDAAFRDFAAPIVAVWNVKPGWQRDPVAKADVERSWAKFTKRAGFKHQRRRWKRWVLVIVLVLLSPFLAVTAFSMYLAIDLMRAARRAEMAISSELLIRLPDSLSLQTLPNGAKYALDSGATLRPAGGDQSGPAYAVWLEGKATFILNPDTAREPVAPQTLSVETKHGWVMVSARAVEVDARDEATYVRVFGLVDDVTRLGRRVGNAGLISADGPIAAPMLLLFHGERGRMIRGASAERIPFDTLTVKVPQR